MNSLLFPDRDKQGLTRPLFFITSHISKCFCGMYTIKFLNVEKLPASYGTLQPSNNVLHITKLAVVLFE